MAQKKSKERPEELFSPFFTFLRALFFRPNRLSIAPAICPWVSEDETWQASTFSLAARKLERQPNADRLSGGLLRRFLGSRWSSRGSGVEELSEWEVGHCLFSPLFSLLSSSFTLLILDE